MSIIIGKGYKFNYADGSFVPDGTTDLHFVKKSQPVAPNFRLMKCFYWNHTRYAVEPLDSKYDKFMNMYDCGPEMISRSVSLRKLTGLVNPWLVCDEEMNTLEMGGNSLAYRSNGRTMYFDSVAIWCSYMVWLHCKGENVPIFDELANILQMAKEVYLDREGYGNIVHMYHTFKSCSLSFPVPPNWFEVIFQREEIDVFKRKLIVLPVENERSEALVDIVIEAMTVGEPDNLKLVKEEDLVTEGTPVEMEKFTNDKVLSLFGEAERGHNVYYYGKYVAGLRGDLLAIPWTLDKCLVRMDKNMRMLDKHVFQRAINKISTSNRIYMGTDGCNCVRCSFECSFLCATAKGYDYLNKMGNVVHHEYDLTSYVPNKMMVRRFREDLFSFIVREFLDYNWVFFDFGGGRSMSLDAIREKTNEHGVACLSFALGDKLIMAYERRNGLKYLLGVYNYLRLKEHGFYCYQEPFSSFGIPISWIIQVYSVSRTFIDYVLINNNYLWSDGENIRVGPLKKPVSKNLIVLLAKKLYYSKVNSRGIIVNEVCKVFDYGSRGSTVKHCCNEMVAKGLFEYSKPWYQLADFRPEKKRAS